MKSSHTCWSDSTHTRTHTQAYLEVTHTYKSTVFTSVPYPSEYLVIITLFFPQCSHRSESLEQEVKQRTRREKWLNLLNCLLNYGFKDVMYDNTMDSCRETHSKKAHR